MFVFIIPLFHLIGAQISEQSYSAEELVQVQHISQDNEIYKKYVRDLSILDYNQNNDQQEAEQNNKVVQAFKQFSKELADEAEQIIIENVNTQSSTEDKIYKQDQLANQQDIENQSNIMLQETTTRGPLVEDDKDNSKYKELAKQAQNQAEATVYEELVCDNDKQIQDESDKKSQNNYESNQNSEQIKAQEDQNYATIQSDYMKQREQSNQDEEPKTGGFGKLVTNYGGDGIKKDQKKDQTDTKERQIDDDNNNQNVTPTEVKETKVKENQVLDDESGNSKIDKESQEKPKEPKKRDPLDEDDDQNTKYKAFAKQAAQETEAKVVEQLVLDDDEPIEDKNQKESQEKPKEVKKRDPLDEDDDKNTKYKALVKQAAQETEAKVVEQLVLDDDEPIEDKNQKEPQEKPQEEKKRLLNEDDDQNTKYKALAKQAAQETEAKVVEQLVLDDEPIDEEYQKEPQETPQEEKKRNPLVEDDDKNSIYKALAKQAAEEANAVVKEQILTEDDILDDDDMTPPLNSNDNVNVTEIIPPEEECQVFVPELKKEEKKPEEEKGEKTIIQPSSTKIEQTKQQEISWEPMSQEKPVIKQEKPEQPLEQKPLVITLDNNTNKEKEIIKKLDESIIRGRGGLILDTGTYYSPYQRAKEGTNINQELKKGNGLENNQLQDGDKKELNTTLAENEIENENENEIENNENETENQENISQLQLALKNVLRHSRISNRTDSIYYNKE